MRLIGYANDIEVPFQDQCDGLRTFCQQNGHELVDIKAELTSAFSASADAVLVFQIESFGNLPLLKLKNLQENDSKEVIFARSGKIIPVHDQEADNVLDEFIANRPSLV